MFLLLFRAGVFFEIRKYFVMKSDKIYLLLLFVIIALPVKSQNPVLHYQFNLKAGTTDTIRDESGNGYHAALMGSAKINTLGAFKVVETGNTSGYVKISSNAGQLISTLSNFTISAYLYVDPVQVLTNAGNFVLPFPCRLPGAIKPIIIKLLLCLPEDIK
jgi:hypothetical protein